VGKPQEAKVGEYSPQKSAGKVLAEKAHTRLMEQGCVGEIRAVRRRHRLPKVAVPAERFRPTHE